MLTTVDKLMADPLAWLHPSRVGVPAHWHHAVARGIINKMVVQQFSLPVSATISKECQLTHTIIEHWTLLPETAWFMACQRYRDQILRSEFQHQLSTQAQRFMHFAIVAPAPCDSVDEDTLWSLAYAEMARVFPTLPDEIARCIRLLFPRQADVPRACSAEFDFDPVLFFMALQHARKYSASF